MHTDKNLTVTTQPRPPRGVKRGDYPRPTSRSSKASSARRTATRSNRTERPTLILGIVQSKRYRYLRYEDGSEELCDHQKDPHEWTNLIGNKKYQKLTKKMRAQVLTFQKK